MSRRVRMSPVDTAWLRMDSPANLMMIVGVDVFDGKIDVERLRALLQSHLLCWHQFRSCVRRDLSGVWWQEDEDFDLDHHLVHVQLPGRAGTAELQQLVGELSAQPLDPARPLWQMHLVDNFHGGHALVVRIHHCIADGIALIGVLLGMSTADPNGAVSVPARRKESAPASSPIEQWLKPITAAAVRAIDTAGDLASNALRGYRQVLGDSELAGQAAAQVVQTASRASRDLAALAFMTNDSPTRLKGRPTGNKCVAWNEPLPLADVKAVGKAIGCSVNDVLLACVAGALRSYLIAHGDRIDGAELRAMVPVNLRAPGAVKSLGNKFGLVPLLLPIGVADPVARVYEVRQRMNELKGGYMAMLAMAVLGVAGAVPRFVQRQVLDMLARKATAVMTNVPGPQQPLYMAGARVKRIMFWVPQSGDIGVGVSILSYDGGVQFGLITDANLCPDPQDIIDRFAPEFEQLVHTLLLLPWDEAAAPDVAHRMLANTEQLAATATHLAQAATTGRSHKHADHGQVAASDATHPNIAESTPVKAESAVAARPLKKRSAFAAARAAARGH